MLRNTRQAKEKKPVMVMLHGSGSSAAIFGIQTHLLARELSKRFHLVYLDAYTPSAPGPGILPFFAEMPGYYQWIEEGELPAPARYRELGRIAQYIQAQLDSKNIKCGEIVACLGFSQGALVALGMLGLRMLGQGEWDNLRFAVAIGAGASGNPVQRQGIEEMIRTLSERLGRDDEKFSGYSVQASGVKDAWYQDGKHIARMCTNNTTKTMDYRDGHVVPRQRSEVLKLARLIDGIDEASKAVRPGPDNRTTPSSMAPTCPGRSDSRFTSMDYIQGIGS